MYLLASKFKGTLYCGSTRDLAVRVRQHKDGKGAAFTQRYGVTRLVWYAQHETVAIAYHKEQQIKRWRRDWKKALIEADNPDWCD